jgi:regulatory protein
MMNPTSNKKDFDDLSTSLKDLAYAYIEKYSPSKQQLKVYLMKKILFKFKSSKSKKDISNLIDKVILRLNKINQSLRTKGIDHKYIKQSLEKIKNKEIDPDFVSALKLCKRRRIGAIRPTANRELFYKKDMGVLARAGFDYDLSKRVLSLEQEEFKKLIKII